MNVNIVFPMQVVVRRRRRRMYRMTILFEKWNEHESKMKHHRHQRRIPSGQRHCMSIRKSKMNNPRDFPPVFSPINFSCPTQKNLKSKNPSKNLLIIALDWIFLPSDPSNSRLLQSFRSNSSHSTEEFHCIPCTHQTHLLSLRSNVWTLLRMLLPQLSVYYPSISMMDYDSDHCIDRLVANLIQIPTIYSSHSSV